MGGSVCGAFLLVALGVLGCSKAICPEIGCRPEIAVTYQQPISGEYVLLMVVDGVTYQSTCPRADAPYETNPHVACDANGALLAGVDLGHGDNNRLYVTVELVTGEGATTGTITATLDGVVNSRDCDLVCYRHSGTIAN